MVRSVIPHLYVTSYLYTTATGPNTINAFLCTVPSTLLMARLCALPLPLSLPNRIKQPPRHQVRRTQPHRRPSNQPSRSKLSPQRLLSPPRQQHVETRPSRAYPGGIYFVFVNVEVGAQEEDGWEEHGEELGWAECLGCYEGSEGGWGDG